MRKIIAVNGKICPPEKAFISVNDRGLLFGDCLLEVMLGSFGKIPFLKEHLKRLYSSAQALDFKIPWSSEDLALELKTLAQKTFCAKVYIKLIITGGNQPRMFSLEEAPATKLIFLEELEDLPDKSKTKGISLCPVHKKFDQGYVSIKTNNYLHSIAERKRRKRAGFDDILWVNKKNEVCEASAANIFFVRKVKNINELYTPVEESGILPGITREKILMLVRNKPEVRSKTIKIDFSEIADFDEAFLSSSIQGLVPIKQIGSYQYKTLCPKGFFTQVNQNFKKLILRAVS